MRLKRSLYVVALVMLLLGCSTAKKTYETNVTLDSFMAEKEFKIALRSAQPMLTQAWSQIANSGLLQPGNSVGRIDLSGEGYDITVRGDSVTANVPFYGERRMGGGYNSNTGIQFNGISENLEIVKDEEKKSYDIRFEVSSDGEIFMVSIRTNNTLYSAINIQSSHRTQIWYNGVVEAIDDVKLSK